MTAPLPSPPSPIPPPTPPPPRASFLLFFFFCQTHSQYKITKAAEWESERVLGENPHFLNICISSSSFVLLLKAAFCTNHRGCLRPCRVSEGPHTSTHFHYLSRKPPSLAINKPNRGETNPGQTSQKIDHSRFHHFFFFFSFYSTQESYQVQATSWQHNGNSKAVWVWLIYHVLGYILFAKCYWLTKTVSHIFTMSCLFVCFF